MPWNNILVANIGWDKRYEGQGISSHHGYVVEHGTGAEAYNFSPVGGLFYGYVRSGSALGRYSGRTWTIVFVSKPTEREKLRVVGWYENASVGNYRDRPEYATDSEFPPLDDYQKYVYSAITKSAFIVPNEVRSDLILPQGHRIKSGGIYYASGGETDDYSEQATDRKTMADWLRQTLPPLRDQCHVRRPLISSIPQIDGIMVGDGGHAYGYSPVGESQEHRSLREWVCANPQFVTGDAQVPAGDTETVLASADRVDATFSHAGRSWVVEVKSWRSDDRDHHRGIYQCVKYRAVTIAMTSAPEAAVEAVLVTEKLLTDEHAALARSLNIRHLVAPAGRD